MTPNKDIARLDVRIDRLAERVEYLITRLDEHISNHHGAASRIKLSGATAIVAALVMGIWEAIRQLVL